MSDRFVYLWAYLVAPDRVDDFQEHYGPNGLWADLFDRAPGYLDTHLLQDRSEPGRFITIDSW